MSVCLGLPIRGAAVGPWALWFEVPPPSGPAVLRGPSASPQPSVSSSLVNGVMTAWFGCQSDLPKLVPSQRSDPDMPRLNVAGRSSGSGGKVMLRCCCFLSRRGPQGTSAQLPKAAVSAPPYGVLARVLSPVGGREAPAGPGQGLLTPWPPVNLRPSSVESLNFKAGWRWAVGAGSQGWS